MKRIKEPVQADNAGENAQLFDGELSGQAGRFQGRQAQHNSVPVGPVYAAPCEQLQPATQPPHFHWKYKSASDTPELEFLHNLWGLGTG